MTRNITVFVAEVAWHHNDVMALRNGTLDPRTGKLRPWMPDDYCTRHPADLVSACLSDQVGWCFSEYHGAGVFGRYLAAFD